MKTAYEFNKERIRTIVPSMAYDGMDIEKWQEEARAKLVELLGLDKFEKCDPAVAIEYTEKIENATEIRFTFQSETGYRIPCHLLIPDNSTNPPVMITVQGHSTGMHISLGRCRYPGDKTNVEGDRDFAIRALKEGFAAVTIEQRNFGECGAAENGSPRCYESTMNALLMGRTTIGERVWDIMRLIDVLKACFSDRVDVSCICLMGNSGGGTATAYTAALEKRLTLAMPSCSVCTFRDSIGAMTHCSCNYVPRIAEYFDMGDLICMAAPTAYIQVNGTNDDIFPVEPSKEVFMQGKRAYDDMGAGERIVHVIGNGGHRFYADESWPYVHSMTGR